MPGRTHSKAGPRFQSQSTPVCGICADYRKCGVNRATPPRRIGGMAGTSAPNVGVMIRGWDIRKGTIAEMSLNAARRAEALGLDSVLAGDHVTFYGSGNDGLI